MSDSWENKASQHNIFYSGYMLMVDDVLWEHVASVRFTLSRHFATSSRVVANPPILGIGDSWVRVPPARLGLQLYLKQLLFPDSIRWLNANGC